jgi:hypothetical protein
MGGAVLGLLFVGHEVPPREDAVAHFVEELEPILIAFNLLDEVVRHFEGGVLGDEALDDLDWIGWRF